MTPDLVTPAGFNSLANCEQPQRSLVARAGADDAIEARHGLGVVIEDFGAGVDDDANGFFAALEVGDENFDAAAGSLAADLFDDHGEGAGAAEEIVVAIDAGDDGVFEAKGGDSFSHAAGLVEVDGLGAAFGHGAESAAARAEIAEHHEGGGLVVPALADVGAVGAFAHGVQVEGARQPLEVVVVFAHRRAGLEPLGLGRGGRAEWRNLHQFHLFIVAGQVGGDGRTVGLGLLVSTLSSLRRSCLDSSTS